MPKEKSILGCLHPSKSPHSELLTPYSIYFHYRALTFGLTLLNRGVYLSNTTMVFNFPLDIAKIDSAESVEMKIARFE